MVSSWCEVHETYIIKSSCVLCEKDRTELDLHEMFNSDCLNEMDNND